MIEKEEFFDFIYCGGDYMDNPELDRRNQLRKQIRERLKQI